MSPEDVWIPPVEEEFDDVERMLLMAGAPALRVIHGKVLEMIVQAGGDLLALNTAASDSELASHFRELNSRKRVLAEVSELINRALEQAHKLEGSD